MAGVTVDTAQEVDDELVEIFVEEATEVIKQIDARLPQWRERPEDRNALTDLRRAFHTLKGSGRMVKAMDIGELSWKIENMLNRVLDGTVRPNPSMGKLIGVVRETLPQLLEAFQARRPAGIEYVLEALMGQADALSNGEAVAEIGVPAAPAPAAAAPAVAAPTEGLAALQVKIAELIRRVDRATQRADESLHRSELSLQSVRKLTQQVEESKAGTGDYVSQEAVGLIQERLKLVTKELQELRALAKSGQQQALVQAREIRQAVDHRLKEKLAPMQSLEAEVTREVASLREALAAARRGAWVAAMVSAVVVGGVLFGVALVVLKSMPG